MDKFDVLLRNGRIVDGTGAPWFHGDVGIIGERIGSIGDLSGLQANRVIDATDFVVCPGFIDIHTHSDRSFIANPKADSKITQGVTTEIVGNCGYSPAPISESGKEYFVKECEELGIKWSWNSVAEYLRLLESLGLPLNVGLLIGHGSIRASVMGFEAREPTPAELEQMKSMVEAGMKEGAFGFSTGIKYAPGCYAKTDEIIELAKVTSKYRGIYTSHIRNQGDLLVGAIDEAIEIGRKSGAPVQIAHLKSKGRSNWGKASNVLRIIDEARESGLDVTFDQYPYPAGSTNLDSATPEWAREGGPQRLLERLKDPEQRRKIEAEIPKHEDWYGPDKIIISGFAPNPSYEGKTIEEIAKIRNKPPVSVFCDLIIESGDRIPSIGFYGIERDILEIMQHHAMMVGSDGSSLASYGVLGKGKPHPRNYGCFTRFLRSYVMKGVMSLEEGIRKMTSFPAQRLDLRDRGLLRTNLFADIVAFHPDKVTDTATFENPHQYSKGIEWVLVNGQIAIENGKFTGKLAGKPLRHTTHSQ